MTFPLLFAVELDPNSMRTWVGVQEKSGAGFDGDAGLPIPAGNTGGANTKITKKINEPQMNTNEYKWIGVVEGEIG